MNYTTRRHPRTLADAFPDATWRSGIEHFRRPTGLGPWRLIALACIAVAMLAAFS